MGHVETAFLMRAEEKNMDGLSRPDTRRAHSLPTSQTGLMTV